MRHRLIAAVFMGVLLFSGCGQSPAVHVSSSHTSAAGYRLYLRQGFGGTQQIHVVNSASGVVERQLPLGTPAPDWSRLYVVAGGSPNATLKAIQPSTGKTLDQIKVPSGFLLPDLDGLGPIDGISPNGRWLALTQQVFDLQGTTSSFLVGDSSLAHTFTQIDLRGDFQFDALSNDGNNLYLIQKLTDAKHYQVRLYNVAGHSLATAPVVDKREPNEPMYGIRGNSIAATGANNVYTVYVRDKGPFIHALPLEQPFAFCVDLPKKSGSFAAEDQSRWSLALSPDESRVYAVNPALGLVTVMSTTGNAPAIVKTVNLPSGPTSWLPSPVLEADAKGAGVGELALTGDGRTLFAVGMSGLLAIDTQSFQAHSVSVNGSYIDSLHMSSDSAWLFAARAGDQSKLWQINPATGALVAETPITNNTWAVLWAEPE